MKKILILISIVVFLYATPRLFGDENKVGGNTDPGSNSPKAETASNVLDKTVSVVTDEEKSKKMDTIVKETKDIIKRKEEHVEEVKKEAAKVIEEKKEIEKEAKLKEEAAAVTKQQAEVLKKEAELTKSREDLKKAKEVEKEASALEKESSLYNEKVSIAESKAQLALENIAAKQTRLESLKKSLEGLQKEKSEKRPLIDKLSSTALIILVGFAAFFIMRFSLKTVEKLLSAKGDTIKRELALRTKTLVKVFNWLAAIMLSIVVVYMVLENLGFSVAPLLAGAGIIGIAFGFGGQYLIRDVISGFFILMEGQYNINDVIQIGEYGGLVENINLRITTLRDLEGRVIFIPNGEIKTVVNFTKEYAQALLSIGVAYKEDVDKVMDVIKQVGKELRADPYFGNMILDDLEMFGVDDFGDSAVIIKFRIKTLPIKQWDISREFRRRLKNRFDELGIEIPFPHRMIYYGKNH
jgi:moderate conductance mechanosensitive channel